MNLVSNRVGGGLGQTVFKVSQVSSLGVSMCILMPVTVCDSGITTAAVGANAELFEGWNSEVTADGLRRASCHFALLKPK
jgi:hypothetical protein